MIAEEVTELGEHERRLQMGAYRPSKCARCGGAVHAHDRRSRLLLGDAAGSTEIARYRCARRKRCGAVWRVLPALLARHLWRGWSTVERAVLSENDAAGADAVPVPAATVKRWRKRLLSSAAALVAALATAYDVPELAAVMGEAGYDATRAELVAIYGEHVPSVAAHAGGRLGNLAGLIHRLAPGVRLM